MGERGKGGGRGGRERLGRKVRCSGGTRGVGMEETVRGLNEEQEE